MQCIWAGSESLLGSCCFSVEVAAFTFQQNLSKLTIGSCCENMDTSWCGSVFTCLEFLSENLPAFNENLPAGHHDPSDVWGVHFQTFHEHLPMKQFL